MYCQNSVGFWARLGATLLDGILLSIAMNFISSIFFGQYGRDEAFPFDLIDLLYYLILPIIWHGYTVGKRILGIRIVRVDGEKLGLGTMALRNIVAGIVYVVTFGVGIIVSAIMVGIRDDNRSIHDLIAGTYVTYDPPEI
ncbi:RDD family protein [Bacillus suaedae]|uniref:RDD family protein n=1 Tax=Halalkalibacter suaedae TaxID=2822140 RepID=A0A940WST6_9BACI|nr:RDD family protein [Bacillus suaedae]MBP3951845.1 RDD family protein [Bacillus suaedae]